VADFSYGGFFERARNGGAGNNNGRGNNNIAQSPAARKTVTRRAAQKLAQVGNYTEIAAVGYIEPESSGRGQSQSGRQQPQRRHSGQGRERRFTLIRNMIS